MRIWAVVVAVSKWGRSEHRQPSTLSILTKRPQCESGGYYDEKGKIHLVCPEPSAFQVIVADDALLMVLCTRHAGEIGRMLVAGSPNVKMEYLPWD